MSTKLSDFFIGVAAKRLRTVEIFSNQHEFNGVTKFQAVLGVDKRSFEGIMIYLPDEEENIIRNVCDYTWYDVRTNNPNRSAEFRLYFSDNEVVPNGTVGDLVILAKDIHDKLVVVVAPAGSTSEQQLLYLFGLEEDGNKFIVKDLRKEKRDIGFAGRYLLEVFGLEPDQDDTYLEDMINCFGLSFPSTRDFSAYARATVGEVSAIENPDLTLLTWWEQEGKLLRTFEKAIIKNRLEQGFGDDTDAFIAFSLSVLNRRKSRAGHSFENHLETLFIANDLSYARGGKTENNNKPDFIFPSIEKYQDKTFKTELLTMLGVKTTLKDRWRQVLSEADRIPHKHLVTLEPAISKNQTDQIRTTDLQLVIPQQIKETFSVQQQSEIMNLSDFVYLLKTRQTIYQTD